MAIFNPQLIGRDMSYGKLTKAEQKILKNNYGRLWEVMAAGNVVPLKTQGAKTVNFESVPADEEKNSRYLMDGYLTVWESLLNLISLLLQSSWLEKLKK